MITTEQLAAMLHLKPQSIRKRYCETGAYYGVRPTKLPNGRLMWSPDTLTLLSEGAK